MASADHPLVSVGGGCLTPSADTIAQWKTIPSWYVVAQDDRAINPDLERFYAKRMGAKTTEIKASRVAFISHPAQVARVIEQAASATVK